ncbi:hypothetical protein BVY01_03385 [bacterium I07]|nr:hypothetical protein BVY01_03385 [bacterium I07]
MKIALLGFGNMGRIIDSLARKKDFEIVKTYDINNPLKLSDRVQDELKDVSVFIDFSISEEVLEHVKICTRIKKNMVIGTTGWGNQFNAVQKLVEESGTGVVYASNFSIGINLFYKIVQRAANEFKSFNQYFPFILESHHRGKRDAPSGTALTLKDEMSLAYQSNDIPVSSVRAGFIPGTHIVGFDSNVDSIELKHTARNREGFAEGALLAARWIHHKKGMFPFSKVLEAMQ